jgi:O-antigen/teichoic acid export membrane protein
MIRRRLLTGALSNFGGKLISTGTWFVLTPFMLAELGPRGYALWVLMTAVGSYGSLLDFGIGGAVVKYVAEHVARSERHIAKSVIATALWLSLGLALATAGLTVLIAPVLPGLLGVPADERSTAMWLVILTGLDLAITIAFTPPVSVLRGLQRYDLYNGVNVAGSLLLAGATVGALLAGGGVLGMVAMNIPVTIVMRVVACSLIKHVAPDLTLEWRGASLAALRRIAWFSSSAFVIDVAGRLQNKTDEFVIALFGALSAVTPYALARRLGEATALAAVQCLKVVMPLASELDAVDHGRKLRKLYIVASRLALGIASPVAVVLVIVAGPILALWVGPSYAEHANLAAVLGIASLIAASQWPASEILQGMAKHRIVASTSLAAGVANMALSILLLPVFGLMGVALGTLIPTAIASLCVVMPFANRTLKVSWHTALWEIWLPGILPGVCAAGVLWTLARQVESPSMGVLMSWVVATVLVYGVGYLSMPASRAERQLVSDLVIGGSRRLRRLRPGSIEA